MSAKYKLPEEYTAISNELLEAILRTRMPGRHKDVFLAILRKTYGWQKVSDVLALSQLAELAEIDRAHVSRILQDLKRWRLIWMQQQGAGRGRRTVIGPDPDSSRWAIGATARAMERSKVATGSNNPDAHGMLPPVVANVATGSNANVATGSNHKRKKETLQKKGAARAPRTAPKRQETNGQGMEDSLPLALPLISPGTAEAGPFSEPTRLASPESPPSSAAPPLALEARPKGRTKSARTRSAQAAGDVDVWSMEPDVGRLLNLLSKREGSRREHEIWLQREAPKMPPYVEKKIREGFSPSGAWVATLNAFWSRYEGSDDHWAYAEARHQEQAAADRAEMIRQGVDPDASYTEDETGDAPLVN